MDSINMTTDPRFRLSRFHDAFAFSLAVLDSDYKELSVVITTLAPAETSKVIHAISIVWRLVDYVNRVRELAQSLPQSRPLNVKRRSFLEETKIVERFRHYVQHLRTELHRSDPNLFPVWGAFSWFDGTNPSRWHTACTGKLWPGTVLSGPFWDTVEERCVSRTSLSIEGVVFNVDPLVKSTHDFCAHAVRSLKLLGKAVGASSRTLQRRFARRAQKIRRRAEILI